MADAYIKQRYTILDDGKAIRCEACQMVSHNLEDVQALYCSKCVRFHDADQTPLPAEMRRTGLTIWTVYEQPTDYPFEFVARLFLNDKPTDTILRDTTLSGLRGKLPPGLVCLSRSDDDDPAIVESWL